VTVSDTARLREAAALFVKLAKDAGRELALDESGVAWADEYVRAVSPVEDENQLRVQTALVGSYFGECLAAAGGGWREGAGEWAIELGGETAYPFRLTAALLRGTGDGSLLASFLALTGGRAPEPAETPAASEAPSVDAVRRVAGQMRDAAAANGGPAEFGEALVAFVDRFVETTRPVDPELMDAYVGLVGGALGESLVAAYGGEWKHTGDAWLVDLGPRGAVHPFSAARRQLEGEGGESILAFFRAVAGDAGEG
jgi:hypothetical protein